MEKGNLEKLKAAGPTLSVGMLTANLLSLGSEIDAIQKAGIQLLHFDVMDGNFCPMLTLGPPMIKGIKTTLLKDVHLVINHPLESLPEYVAAGADMITFHVEATHHPHQVLQALKKMNNANDPARGILRGVALNPGTPLEVIDPLIDEVEMVCLLAVNPGWGGQKFIPSTFKRAERTRQIIRNSGRKILLGIDGGITRDNFAEVTSIGADIYVTGSAVFDGKDPSGNVKYMFEILERKNGERK